MFVAVAERGSFSAAAEALAVSRNMASRHVADLEAELGVRLLNRTTRRVSLTSTGAAYLDRARQVLADLAEADREASLQSQVPRGRLRVNAPMSFGIHHVAPTLAAYIERHPEVSVDLVLNDRIVDLVEEGYDLALRIGALADSSLVARQLGAVEMIACAAPAYLFRHGRPAHPRELADHRCLAYSYLQARDLWTFAGPGGEATVKVAPRMWSNNGDAVAAAAVAGAGIIVQPDFIVRPALAAGRLERVLDGWHAATMPVHALYPRTRQVSLKVRTFIDHLLACYHPIPPWRVGS